MIKYILHGGNTSEINKDNNSFFVEMTAGIKGKIKILLNYFSKKDGESEKLSKQDIRKFKNYSKNTNLEFEIANLITFEKQLKWANVMYMRGGDCDKIIWKMSKFVNLEKLFQNKLIAGSSAGAYVLAKYHYCNDDKKIKHGLGILNFKLFCHYASDESKKLKKLLDYGDKNLPLLTLQNYQWVVIYQ